MDLDDPVAGVFGTAHLDRLDPAAFAAGLERLQVMFGAERDSGRRFALWTLLHALGQAPGPADAFRDDAATRRAAEDYLRAAASLEEE